ncbi:protein CutA isoform X1 [Chrysemys picta bellii]|uniref:protein CutA isoform X1 n=1 Tax=Chrysemys picta bellii TaxID=8478 RepID=UPI0032B2E4BB
MVLLLRTVYQRLFSMAAEAYTPGSLSAAFVTCPNEKDDGREAPGCLCQHHASDHIHIRVEGEDRRGQGGAVDDQNPEFPDPSADRFCPVGAPIRSSRGDCTSHPAGKRTISAVGWGDCARVRPHTPQQGTICPYPASIPLYGDTTGTGLTPWNFFFCGAGGTCSQ